MGDRDDVEGRVKSWRGKEAQKKYEDNGRGSESEVNKGDCGVGSDLRIGNPLKKRGSEVVAHVGSS
jgi:hypothetical protein